MGLVLAPFLVVAALTGAVLPYAGDLNRMMAPELWRASPPGPDAQVLSGIELLERVERQTGATASYVRLALEPDRAQAVFIEPRPGGPALDCNEVVADPYTGAVRRCLRYGDLSEGIVNLMPFLVRLHYSLAAGSWGIFLFGIAALVWTVECLLGLWLTVPRGGRTERATGAGPFKRWIAAWGVRRDRGATTLLHDLHRAAGLWLLIVMLIFAWSAVAFNLQPVHAPVQRLFGAQGLYQPATNERPDPGPAMTRAQALDHGRKLMDETAAKRGFVVRRPYAISWDPYARAVGYYALTSLDGPTELASTVVWFDESSGRMLAFRHPYGDTAADAVDKTSRMLHTAALFGWPYKAFVSLVGLATAGMVIAGVTLWFKRRRARLLPGRQERPS